MENNKKVVLITGGGKGIGFGVAQAFAQEGYNIVITGRTEQVLLDAKNKLEDEYGVKVLPIAADGSKEEEVKRVIAKVKAVFGRLDVLINNAQASASGKLLVEHTKEDFDLAIETGLYAVFFYMREAFELLKESKGSVINFASGAGIAGRLGQSSYAAAKEGIRGITRVAANEWGEYGINVNNILPLVMSEQLQNWKEEYPDIYEKTIQNIPLQRFGDAKNDIGRVCVFLASDAASFISGDTINLQGGSGLRP